MKRKKSDTYYLLLMLTEYLSFKLCLWETLRLRHIKQVGKTKSLQAIQQGFYHNWIILRPLLFITNSLLQESAYS